MKHSEKRSSKLKINVYHLTLPRNKIIKKKKKLATMRTWQRWKENLRTWGRDENFYFTQSILIDLLYPEIKSSISLLLYPKLFKIKNSIKNLLNLYYSLQINQSTKIANNITNNKNLTNTEHQFRREVNPDQIARNPAKFRSLTVKLDVYQSFWINPTFFSKPNW